MKRLARKIGAGVLAATLVMGSSLVVFAEDVKTGTSGGAGTIEGIVETDVFKADLPTAATNAYDYIVDPQGLIRKTDAAKYTGATFGEGSVFFKNSDTSYSDTSNAATIVNKSSAPLTVTVKAKATKGSDGNNSPAADIAASKTFGDSDTDLKVYLGLSDSVTGSTEKALTGTDTAENTDAILKAVLGAAPEDAYEYSYDNGAYSYAIKSDVSGFKFAEYSFQITGVANDKAAWKADTALPTVSVTWDVDLAGASDTVTVPTPDQTPAYTDAEAHGHWDGGFLWLAKDASTGFSTSGLTVEVSDGGTTYTALATDKYSINEDGWVSVTWENIVAGIGSEPTGQAHVRVTDGNTRYDFENQ